MTHGVHRPVARSGAAGHVRRLLARTALTGAVCVALTVPARAQEVPAQGRGNEAFEVEVSPRPFRSRADSVEWERARDEATRARGMRVIVSLRERRVTVIRGDDTLRTAEAAVASGLTIEYAGRAWTFRTPRGRHTVLRRVEDPVWRPPDWLYAEAALEHGLAIRHLQAGRPVRVDANRSLVVRGGLVGLLDVRSGDVVPLPTDEHVVFNDTLYIPPFATENRHVPGELGRYALDLGDGYLIHGTSNPSSIGRAVTHGCIRLGDDDIAWLYQHVPPGTAVYIY
ncbi:putative L,D-transpeptidase YnhG [Anaerolineae bacterium]|nr:putative L,D-transpeptidase YnhG [Anaerolineae bacterium]